MSRTAKPPQPATGRRGRFASRRRGLCAKSPGSAPVEPPDIGSQQDQAQESGDGSPSGSYRAGLIGTLLPGWEGVPGLQG